MSHWWFLAGTGGPICVFECRVDNISINTKRKFVWSRYIESNQSESVEGKPVVKRCRY